MEVKKKLLKTLKNFSKKLDTLIEINNLNKVKEYVNENVRIYFLISKKS